VSFAIAGSHLAVCLLNFAYLFHVHVFMYAFARTITRPSLSTMGRKFSKGCETLRLATWNAQTMCRFAEGSSSKKGECVAYFQQQALWDVLERHFLFRS
jgi:hypothetical protein